MTLKVLRLVTIEVLYSLSMMFLRTNKDALLSQLIEIIVSGSTEEWWQSVNAIE
jgi:hypothetical protein